MRRLTNFLSLLLYLVSAWVWLFVAQHVHSGLSWVLSAFAGGVCLLLGGFSLYQVLADD